MCHADAMSRLPLNDPGCDEVPLPAKGVFLLQTLDYSPITSEQIRMTCRDPVLSKILDYVTTGSWPTYCFDTNLSAHFNKQGEISIEQGCVWGTHVIIPSSGRDRVLELLHESNPGIFKMKSIARECVGGPNWILLLSHMSITVAIVRQEQQYHHLHLYIHWNGQKSHG